MTYKFIIFLINENYHPPLVFVQPLYYIYTLYNTALNSIMIKRTDFVYSQESEPHRIRTKKILKQFPHLRNLIGKNPLTMLAIIGLVGFMVGMAWLVREQSWWVIFGAAYLLGLLPITRYL